MIENKFISIEVQQAGRRLGAVIIQDKINGRSYELSTDIFSLLVQDEQTDEACSVKQTLDSMQAIKGAELSCAKLEELSIPAKPSAIRLAERREGKRILATFAVPSNGYTLSWWIELRDDSPYLRVGLELYPGQAPMPLRKITLLNILSPEARVEGTVRGAPIVAAGNRLFAGLEHPMSMSEVDEKGFRCCLELNKDLPLRTISKFSAVLGFSEPSQLRRSFQLGYINVERARPYAPFLNYNSWYDIGYFSRYDEKQALDTIRIIGEELVKKRGAVIDSFLLDDGWDNPETLWAFHKGMPNEFQEARKLAESYNSSPGTWLSPWGGYGEPKQQRLAAAEGKFETNERGFTLTGEKYYARFREMCLHMIRENGINHFKFDGTSGEATPAPGSKFGSDFEAIISIIDELREEMPEIYINLTTGTWASPFWFGIADSIWRRNWDHDFCGEGSARNQWMTFRDAMIYENNVVNSPLFPINSLMTHGVIYNKGARGLTTTEGEDLHNEIWSGFGLGTQMQELYITPSMLKPEEWDSLAAAAKWARANGDVMADTHWVGGNPAEPAVYGWASWNPEKAVLTLRNPSSCEQSFHFDPAAIFELPVGAPTKYSISSPKGDKLPSDSIEVGKSVSILLAPFEVIVIDARPIN